MTPAEVIERERRWATPAGLLAILAVALFAASLVILASNFSADGDAAALREVDQDSGTFLLAHVVRALGAALLAVPLVYLFRAAAARSETMRTQLIGLVAVTPLFLAIFTVLDGLSVKEAASDFVARGVAGSGERADEIAQDMLEDTSLRSYAFVFGIAGTVGFAIGMAYTCFHSMKVGLLTRFTGSLGTAVGVVSVLGQFFQVALLYIVYLGFLIAGWVPRGRPPAWAAGEAVPWPTPGEQAAESLEPEREGEAGEEESGAGERRKRKRRR